ncbi:MAG: helix-turn-helix domain-containing protein [Clostridia bacterium]|nr:helix-turn-helix domain-containing protein [Clostridia bacterium]
MTQRMFQTLINQAKAVIDREFGIVNSNGVIVASNNERHINTYLDEYDEVLAARQETYVLDSSTYINIGNRVKPDFLGYVRGTGDNYAVALHMLLISAYEIKNFYDEKYDKNRFLKNVLLNNVLPADMILRSRELGVDVDQPRLALLIRTEREKEVAVYDVLQHMFPDPDECCVIVIDEGNIALIRKLSPTDGDEQIERMTQVIHDTLCTETMIPAKIGVGSKASSIKELTRSFKQAQEAIVIGKIFEEDKDIYMYSKLGIGRLVYQLPITACELFINEIFKDDSLETLDEETMTTILKFFENNLNVSEAARQLYIHRNTLVYRLEKIQRNTGLDLTNFDHSVVFYIAILLKKYLANKRDSKL